MKTFITPYEDIDTKNKSGCDAGEKLILKLYKAATATTLIRQRYISNNNTLKSSKATSKFTFTLETLPSTSTVTAARQSQGNHINPVEVGD